MTLRGAQNPWGKSKYRGVSKSHPSDGSRGKGDGWRAQIRDNGVVYHIGVYRTEEEAARAYDARAKKLHRDKQYLNFPGE